MARTSRIQRGAINSKTWNAALYIRLSREDGDKDESDSISNQRDMLEEYLMHASDFSGSETYIDDGFSGTNFDRPGFIRMMDDVRAKKINCIIVKDLSRFGRNYIEVGNYIEQIFPFLDVRFISVNDNLDSYKNPSQLNSIIVPFKNIINDEYARDISQKVRSALTTKRKRGEFIGSFACYGYHKDPDNKGQLIVDEYAAGVVRDIFNWFIEGHGKITIAKRLNSLGVLNPSAYKRSLGLNYKHASLGKNSEMWSYASVRNILRNEMYIGNMVQNRLTVKSYKINKNVKVPEQDWIIVEDTHEPVIRPDVWEKAQDLLSRDMRIPPSQSRVYLLAGFIKCADCMRAMNKKHISHSYGQYFYYVCSSYKKMGKDACTKHTIRTDKLEKALLQSIKMHIEIAVNMTEIIDKISRQGKIQKESSRINQEIARLESALARTVGLKRSLYEDWKSGAVSRAEYHDFKQTYDVDESETKMKLERLGAEKKSYEQGVDSNHRWLQTLRELQNIDTLTRDIVVELVDCVLVHEGGEITIRYKFSDEFKRLSDYIEQNDRVNEK